MKLKIKIHIEIANLFQYLSHAKVQFMASYDYDIAILYKEPVKYIRTS